MECVDHWGCYWIIFTFNCDGFYAFLTLMPLATNYWKIFYFYLLKILSIGDCVLSELELSFVIDYNLAICSILNNPPKDSLKNQQEGKTRWRNGWVKRKLGHGDTVEGRGHCHLLTWKKGVTKRTSTSLWKTFGPQPCKVHNTTHESWIGRLWRCQGREILKPLILLPFVVTMPSH